MDSVGWSKGVEIWLRRRPRKRLESHVESDLRNSCEDGRGMVLAQISVHWQTIGLEMNILANSVVKPQS
jgi:hypothetical protein